MKQNLFDLYLQKKEGVIQLAKQAREFGWIDQERENEIISNIEKDILTIGVIGQIKCGKSTFLNALIFEDDFLPAAITPMTASLTDITYGDTPKLVVEFYTEQEWKEQCELSERSLNGVSEIDEAKISVARELVQKSVIIKDRIPDLLGKTVEDSLDNIVEYVGADGKYVSITKAVKVYHPKEYLKGVEVVDTPGFNDPIRSREERTKEFLEKADVIILLLSASMPFGKEDRTILFEDVRKCGIGKIIIGINKYDIPFERAERPEEIKNYVAEQIKNECNRRGDSTMNDILKQVDPLFLSAEMALLSELPMKKISNSEIYSYAIKRYADKLGISGQSKLREMSRLDEFSDSIRKMIENEKDEIIIKKPVNAIVAAGKKEYDRLVTEISDVKTEIKFLNIPDEALETKERNIVTAKHRLERRIDMLNEELDISVSGLSRRGRYALEDALEDTCKRMEKEINNVRLMQKFDSVKIRLNQLAIEFETRTVRRIIEQMAEDMKRILKSSTRDFFSDSNVFLVKSVEDVDVHEYIEVIEDLVNSKIDDNSIFAPRDNFSPKEGNVWGYVLDAGVGFGFGLLGLGVLTVIRKVILAFKHDDDKNKLLAEINNIRNEFDAQKIVDVILRGKDNVINVIQQMFDEGLIKPMQQMIADCQTQKTNKEQRIKYLEEKLNSLSESRNGYEKQKALIDNMVASATLN